MTAQRPDPAEAREIVAEAALYVWHGGHSGADIGDSGKILAERIADRAIKALTAAGLSVVPKAEGDRPWLRCPSTHCERRGECASPNDCIVKSKAEGDSGAEPQTVAEIQREIARLQSKLAGIVLGDPRVGVSIPVKP